MSRIVRVVLVAIMAVSVLAWDMASNRTTSADETVAIPYTVIQERSTSAKVGDSCVFHVDPVAFGSPYNQIEIRNAEGDVVGLATLKHGKIVKGDNSSIPACVEMEKIEVPASSFYTVSFDSMRYQSFAATDFPLTETDVMWVMPSQE